jgi:hypothetical protein
VDSSFSICSGRERSRSRFGRAEIGGGGAKTDRNRAVIYGWADKSGGVRGQVGDQRKSWQRGERRPYSAGNLARRAMAGRPAKKSTTACENRPKIGRPS